MMATSKTFIFDCTCVPLIGVLLFCGDLSISKKRDKIVIGKWIQVKSSELHAVLYRRLQEEISFLLDIKTKNPHQDIVVRQNLLIEIVKLLLAEV